MHPRQRTSQTHYAEADDGGGESAARFGIRPADRYSDSSTSRAARWPERTAPSMYPHQISEHSVPAQWMAPTGARSAWPKRDRTFGGSGETQPLDQGSASQSVST